MCMNFKEIFGGIDAVLRQQLERRVATDGLTPRLHWRIPAPPPEVPSATTGRAPSPPLEGAPRPRCTAPLPCALPNRAAAGFDAGAERAYAPLPSSTPFPLTASLVAPSTTAFYVQPPFLWPPPFPFLLHLRWEAGVSGWPWFLGCFLVHYLFIFVLSHYLLWEKKSCYA
jgi:hypothetical protein